VFIPEKKTKTVRQSLIVVCH